MRLLPVSEIRVGMTIELVDDQRLLKTSSTPWQSLTAGATLVVVAVAPMPTGRTDRQPYELSLRDADGDVIGLEVADGTELMAVVGSGD